MERKPAVVYLYGERYDTAEGLVNGLFPKLGIELDADDITNYLSGVSYKRELHEIPLVDVDVRWIFRENDVAYRDLNGFLLVLGKQEDPNKINIQLTNEQAEMIIQALYADASAIADGLYTDLRLSSSTKLQDMQNSAKASINLVNEMKTSIELINIISEAMEKNA